MQETSSRRGFPRLIVVPRLPPQLERELLARRKGRNRLNSQDFVVWNSEGGGESKCTISSGQLPKVEIALHLTPSASLSQG